MTMIDRLHSGGHQAPTLVIDARNALYRAIYAYKAELNRGNKPAHPFVIYLRLANNWIRLYNPESVYVFWDVPRHDVWRRKILTTYKARENNQYVVDISDDLKSLTDLCQEMFKHMNIRQFIKKHMEADDLIYTAVSVLHPNPTIVISTDSDMIQIPYRFSSCKLFEPKKQIEVTVPKFDPVLLKVLKGDKSDHIPGYRGIGPKKAMKLINDKQLLQEYIDTNDKLTYYRNLLLIDLSMCPKILNNTIYVRKKIAEKTIYDKAKLLELAQTCKIDGLLAEFNDLVIPYQKLI